MDFRFLKLYKIPILLVLSSIAFYFTFAYALERHDFIRLISLYAGLCFFSYKIIQLHRNNFWFLAGLALVFRLVFMFSLPNLSQDYFRFIWDGRLIAAGWNPYEFLPVNLVKDPGFYIHQAKDLILGMGSLSAGHYSNYPPVNQLIFAISGWLSAQSILGAVVIFRLIMILADIGTLFFGRKLLRSLGLPEEQIFWYILNPFIIIEMTGNLHFEAVMVFFLVLSLWLIHRNKWIAGAVVLGLSISVKLLPLLFLPLFFGYFNKSFQLRNISKLILFYSLCLLTVALSFLPFYSEEVFSNFMNSVGLWFGKFEFNASVYYIVRWIGFEVKGYNIIETAGKVLPVITFLSVLFLSFFRGNYSSRKLIKNMLFAITVYLLLSTTVHPWYLAIPLILSILTRFKYVLVWSGVVMLSYYAYSNSGYEENFWLIALEYIAVLSYMVYELFRKPKPEVV
ncbi:mannosyltransferase [Christiangramia aquimixticola]|uniref:mannosyltransferase n=1 Tax=Christiangramia aquimixticola TaxID=1697558 RepID=UPI003AA81A45